MLVPVCSVNNENTPSETGTSSTNSGKIVIRMHKTRVKVLTSSTSEFGNGPDGIKGAKAKCAH